MILIVFIILLKNVLIVILFGIKLKGVMDQLHVEIYQVLKKVDLDMVFMILLINILIVWVVLLKIIIKKILKRIELNIEKKIKRNNILKGFWNIEKLEIK